MVDILEKNNLAFYTEWQNAPIGDREAQIRRLSVADVLAMVQAIENWRKRTIPVLNAYDTFVSKDHIIELFVSEVHEVEEAFGKLSAFFKDNWPLKTRLQKQEYNVLLRKVSEELVDVFVFLVSLLDKFADSSDFESRFNISNSIQYANGQGIAENVFENLRQMVQNIERTNKSDVFHLLQTLVSFVNHFPHPIDLKAATFKKLSDNTANRDFEQGALLHSDGSPFSEAEIQEMYHYQNLFSKQLRKLFSGLLGREINPLEAWMKAPFADLYRDITLFRHSGLEEARQEIYKRFILFLKLIENQVDFSQEQETLMVEGLPVVFSGGVLELLRGNFANGSQNSIVKRGEQVVFRLLSQEPVTLYSAR